LQFKKLVFLQLFDHHDAMKHFAPWLAAAAILVIIFGTMYGVVQQDQRSAGNEPQIEVAEDTATLLNSGMTPSDLTDGATNMAASLAPFVNIYTQNGVMVSGSGLLDGRVPMPPIGLLKASESNGYHAETWQPGSNVRIAAVVVKASKYYVLAGRSIKQIELNETKTFDIALGGACLSLAVLGLLYLSIGIKRAKKA
jgi:hypothetical protein